VDFSCTPQKYWLLWELELRDFSLWIWSVEIYKGDAHFGLVEDESQFKRLYFDPCTINFRVESFKFSIVAPPNCAIDFTAQFWTGLIFW
jgi:hypothetical protein